MIDSNIHAFLASRETSLASLHFTTNIVFALILI